MKRLCNRSFDLWTCVEGLKKIIQLLRRDRDLAESRIGHLSNKGDAVSLDQSF